MLGLAALMSTVEQQARRETQLICAARVPMMRPLAIESQRLPEQTREMSPGSVRSTWVLMSTAASQPSARVAALACCVNMASASGEMTPSDTPP
ncbi:hypothetical protein BE04_37585 [Sorangium cellulosum]|uniref:Uncharacterized protein n=2 Tax=Sorangium cellulosum TaxID=56 RepID=A0A150PP32_SORCE|nr:hypothetical protein SCE1572_04340 [Sorangium cellulosum So0157-2]KYF57188.1 hypothetical protein BE04_37585 [Sorangium cellulosum]